MKHIYILILALISCSISAFSQSNYKTGYVVTLRGDTVQGFINYKDWNKNPKQISFKKDINTSKAITYSTASADAFVVKGYEYYKRYAGKISEDGVDVTYLKRGVDTTTKADTVFLRVLSKGKNVTLYEYIDIIKVRYFISNKNSSPVELSYHVFFDLMDNSKVAKERGYMQQLQNLATAYQPQDSTIAEVISNTDYTSEGLKKIVFKLNGSSSLSTTTSDIAFNADNHGKTRLYIGTGANVTSVNFNGVNTFSGLKASNYVFPMINVGADFFLNKDVGKFLVRINVGLTSNHSSFSVNSVNTALSTSTYVEQVLKFNQLIASLNPQLLYNILNNNKLKVYFAAGVVINFAPYSNEQNYVLSSSTGGATTKQDFSKIEVVDLQSIYIAGNAKIGFVIGNKIDIYLGYNPPAHIYTTADYAIKSTSYQAGINFLFGK